jgi:hypothetical protein
MRQAIIENRFAEKFGHHLMKASSSSFTEEIHQ